MNGSLRFQLDKRRGLGFTLIELLVAIPISLIILLGVGATLSYTIEQFLFLSQKKDAETSLLWASYYTQAYFSQAVDTRFIGNQDMMDDWMTDVKNAGGFKPTIHGRIDKTFDSSDISVGNKLSTIGVFYREDGDFRTGYGSSDLAATAVYFQNPATSPGVPSDQPPYGGVLYFSSSVGSAASTLEPSLSTVWYDRLSFFKIIEVECFKNPSGDDDVNSCDGGDPDDTSSYIMGADKVKSITFLIRARYFKSINKNKWIWCTGDPQCKPQIVFNEVERIVKVGFRNNILSEVNPLTKKTAFVGTRYDDRLHGGLYFFKMSLPKLSF